MTVKEFYGTKAWKDCSEAYKRSVGNLCEECLKQGRISPADDVHHIKKLTDHNVSDPRVSLSFDNLMALCNPCHDKKHSKNKRYTIDEWGRVTII